MVLCLRNILLLSAILALSLADVKTVEEYLQELNDFMTSNRGYRNNGNNMEYFPNDNNIYDLEPVDFVVIGIGTAGAIVTNRLTENPETTVMALEAGTYGNVATNITAMSYLLFNSPYNWGYSSTPNKYAVLGYKGKDNVIGVHRGKGIGGNTVLNGVRYVRNSKYDWMKVVAEGNKGWDYETMLQYFKKSENSILEAEDVGYHGKTGPEFIEHARDKYVQTETVIKGLNELNYKTVDYNGEDQIGVSSPQLMSKNGIRYSTARAFIDPIMDKNNVQIMDKAFVTKIDINPVSKVAESVIFSQNNKLYKIRAKKEIILCAGAISSPQILQLSGVGPSNELKRLNIELVQDLPVGQNLIDQPAIAGAKVNFPNHRLPNKTLEQHLSDFVEGRGELAVATGMHAISFHKTKYAGIRDGPDVVATWNIPVTYNMPKKESSMFLPEVYDAVYGGVDLNSALDFNFLMTNPRSRGSITLKSSSPYEYPNINLNLLGRLRDILVVLDGIKLLMKVVDTKAFKDAGAELVTNVFPKCNRVLFFQNLYYKCVAMELSRGGFHTYNTCRMGLNPRTSVVDSELKVHGIKSLRVVDASVLTYVSGFPMAVVMAVAEKASDMIKVEHGL